MRWIKWVANGGSWAPRLNRGERAALARRIEEYLPTGCGARERRRWRRIEVCEDQVFLGWLEGETFQLVVVRIVNINQGGAMVKVQGSPPPFGREVWLRRDVGSGMGSRKAVVQDASPARRGDGYRVRLAFDDLGPGEADGASSAGQSEIRAALESRSAD